MNDYVIRLIVLSTATVLCCLSWIGARRRLSGWLRLPLDYALGLYTLTYAIGCAILFLFGTDYIFRFYGNTAFLPARVSYPLILLVAVMPYICVPWTVVALAVLGGRRDTHTIARTPLRPEAVIVSLAVVLAASFAIIAPVAPLLIGNALGDLAATTSVVELYSQRQEIFETVSFLQGGIIYSVLPPIAAIILFWPSGRPWLTRAFGGSLAAIALLLNLGMFQIGPTLAFVLVCAFCYFASHHGRINPVALAVTITLGVVILGLFSLVKSSSSDIGQIEIFVMRLPIALPYLIQMSAETAVPGGGGSMSLSFELGEYMFPSMRTAHSFVAAPQPGFVDAWFTFNFAAGIAVLIFTGLLIVIFGRLCSSNELDRQGSDGRLILWSSVAAPTLYYVFQVGLFDLFTSAYSITFCLIPTLAILSLNAILPRAAAGRPANRQMRH